MRLKLLILLSMLLFLSIGAIGGYNATTYRSLVDGYNGFYRVINTTTGEPISEYHIFNISVGDNIIWINEDQTDRITIISDQGLWESDAALLEHTDSQFNYTFDSPGVYTFTIKEYKGFPNQTVIVTDISPNNSTDNLDIIPTISPTETTISPPATITISPPDTINPTITISPPDTINPTETTNVILMPLNILSNIKMTGFMAFIIVMIIFFIKD